MGCYCDRRKGGAGKQNTPYKWHLYFCEYMLVDLEGYSYEQFKIDKLRELVRINNDMRKISKIHSDCQLLHYFQYFCQQQ